jgi:hypothetical protein
MFKIEKQEYGYKLTFGGFIEAPEMKQWAEESRKKLVEAPRTFGVFVDMRTLSPLPVDSQEHMQEGQKLYRKKGMTRSVVIVDSAITKVQFRRIAKETGIYEWERYINASAVADWEKVGLDWISEGIDPDKQD